MSGDFTFMDSLSPELIKKELLLGEYLNLEQSNYIGTLNSIKELVPAIAKGEKSADGIAEVRRDVLDSWLRSYKYGVNDKDYSSTLIKLNSQEFGRVEHENQLLITASNNVLTPLKEVFENTHCLAFLTDSKGVILNASYGDPAIKLAHSMIKGVVWNERTVGTGAHSFCIEKGQPFQLWGPEHWCAIFKNSIGSAAPIFDDRQNLLGTLTIGSQFGNFQRMHTLAWVVTLTQMIQREYLMLLNKKKYYEKNTDLASLSTKIDKTNLPFDLRDVDLDPFNSIIGQSAAIKKTVDYARKIACSHANILLTGESGTGKDVFARAFHQRCTPEAPFIVLNCAAIPRNLIESELLGYESGSFTGAEKQGRKGKIELANGGTLFLDEIGDMPLEVQPILLRVLEDKKVMRIGGSTYTPVKFRLITATNKNLRALIKDDEFRLDLYYRLSVFNVCIPPLRERKEDIILLANHFIQQVAAECRIPPPKLSLDVQLRLMNYAWPGNIRQLQNAMVHATYLAAGDVITVENLPSEIQDATTSEQNYKAGKKNSKENINWQPTMGDMEKLTIQNALASTDNNIREAAALLGISKSTLYRRIKEYDL